MKKLILSTSISILTFGFGFSQTVKTSEINTINTAVPFLRISPDARSGAMGDVGIAITPDASATYWNASKLAFIDKNMGVAITYTPWLKGLGINDIYLAHLSLYKKIDKTQTIATSLRYFSLGSIQFTDAQGNNLNNFNPKEFSWDISYARLLSKHLSVSLSGRYIFSNLASGNEVNGVPISSAKGASADVGLYYRKNVKLGKQTKGLLAFGTNISNLGTKVSYTKSATNKDYLPANFGIGSSLKMDFDKYNSLEIALDANKLLVPTPDGTTTYEYKKYSPFEGAMKSWSDAPGGSKEELREINLSFGAEYWYNKQFAVRTGMFYEDPTKGNRLYATLGVGVKYNVFGMNFSYLVPAFRKNSVNGRSPLDNTLRFSLLFDLDAFKTDEAPAAL
ncbi:MAG: hypothetical protein RL065_1136 [Bacteroidota bacterium]